MKRQIGLAAAFLLILASGGAHAQRGVANISAGLEPRQEVPAVTSPARGVFSARIHDDAQMVTYELTFGGLQADVRQAHIHFAQPNVNGGIMVWLCGTSVNPGPAGTQVCPQSGTITGVIGPGHVLPLGTQGLAAGAFDDFTAALRSGLAYVNVHTQQSPGGEIRGQVLPGAGHH